MRGRAAPLIEQTEHVRAQHAVQPREHRSAGARRPPGLVFHPVQPAVLAEVEDLRLAAEVVIEVCGGELRLGRDLAHAGARVPAPAKRPRSSPQDLETPVLGTPGPAARAPRGGGFRTAVHISNHRSNTTARRPSDQAAPESLRACAWAAGVLRCFRFQRMESRNAATMKPAPISPVTTSGTAMKVLRNMITPRAMMA